MQPLGNVRTFSPAQKRNRRLLRKPHQGPRNQDGDSLFRLFMKHI
jgi:hypothetical protein